LPAIRSPRHGQRLRRQLQTRLQRPGGAEGAGGQGQDVLAVPQRRHCHLHHVQPVEEVLAEPPAPDVLLEIPVGGGDDPDIGMAGPVLAHPLEGPFLKEAEQLRLRGGPQLADLVEEQRPSLRGLHPPGRVAHSPGEGAAGVPEQLRDQQLVGEGGGADGDEGPLGPGGESVERPGQHALPRSVLSPEQDGGVGGRGATEEGERRLHRRRPGVEERIGVQAGQAVLQGLHPGPEEPTLVQPLDHRPQLRGGERLGEVVTRPAAHRLHRGVDRGVGGDDHHVEVGVLRQQQGEEVQAALVAEPEVHQGHVGRGPGERRQRGLGRACLTHLAADLLEADPDHGPDVPLVVDHQHPVGRGLARRWR
jgi:hypothetical protein